MIAQGTCGHQAGGIRRAGARGRCMHGEEREEGLFLSASSRRINMKLVLRACGELHPAQVTQGGVVKGSRNALLCSDEAA